MTTKSAGIIAAVLLVLAACGTPEATETDLLYL